MMSKKLDPSVAEDKYQWSYEAHQRRQILLGLQLTPAERLRWLESTVAAMRQIQGRARKLSHDQK